jgi:glutathione S-transferase
VAPLAKVPVLVVGDPPVVIPDSALIIDGLRANRPSALQSASFDLAGWPGYLFRIARSDSTRLG